jgi:chromosome partitioning protein
VVTKTAIAACQHILIPAKPDYLSTLGIDYLIRNVNRLVKHYNQCVASDSGSQSEMIDPRFLGVVFTMVQEYSEKPISSARQFMAEVERLGTPVFKAYVKENKTLFAEAPLNGTPVVLGSPQTPAHRQVIDEIKELVNECLFKLRLDKEVRNGRRGKGIDREDSGSVGRVVQTA